MTPDQLNDLANDLRYLAGRFRLTKTKLMECPSSIWIEVTAKSCSILNGAREELCKSNGLLQFYEVMVGGNAAHQKVENDWERRVDPMDGVARTLEELHELYEGQYSQLEIDEYW